MYINKKLIWPVVIIVLIFAIGIFVFNWLTSPRLRQIYAANIESAVLSNDDEIRYFDNTSSEEGVLKFRSLNLKESTVRNLSNETINDFYSAVWSKDAKKVAYLREGSSDKYTLNALDFEKNKNYLVGETFYEPSWSTDGTEIGYISLNGNKKELMAFNLKTARSRKITDLDISITRIDWLPKNKFIFYSVDPLIKKSSVYLFDVNNNKQKDLVIGGVFTGKASPKGDKLLYVKTNEDGKYQLHLMELNTSRDRSLGISLPEVDTVSWSGDEKFLYLIIPKELPETIEEETEPSSTSVVRLDLEKWNFKEIISNTKEIIDQILIDNTNKNLYFLSEKKIYKLTFPLIDLNR